MELSGAIVEWVSPLLPVKGKLKPYFLHYEPNLWNGPNLILTNTRDWVCLTRGLTTWKMYHEHLATFKTLILRLHLTTRGLGCGMFNLVLHRRQSLVFGRENFCTNKKSVSCCHWASSNSRGDGSLGHSLVDWLISSFIHSSNKYLLSATMC